MPTQIALMPRDPSFDSTDLSSVRAVVMGGGPATPALVREARARIGAPLAVRYSCTEAGIGCGTSFGDPDEDAEVSVGRPRPGVRLSILDEAGAPVEPGAIGEVCLGHRPSWRATGATAGPTPTSSARTAASARATSAAVDERGRLHLAGRSRERYVRGGYNVYPMEVEGVLADHPGVAAVAVVSRNDPVMGEIGVAVVVPQPDAPTPELAQLRDFAAEHLARYKLPEDMVVFSALPLTGGEKAGPTGTREADRHQLTSPRPLQPTLTPRPWHNVCTTKSGLADFQLHIVKRSHSSRDRPSRFIEYLAGRLKRGEDIVRPMPVAMSRHCCCRSAP